MQAFEHQFRVRFHETDPAGIVFFANILVYCHEAYEEFLRAGGLPLENFVGSALAGKLPEQVLPLGHAEATFRKPFRAGQLVTVKLAVGRVGDRTFRLEYELYDEVGEHLATAATVHVAVDPRTHRSTEVAPALRAWLGQYLRGAG